jgi:hypothetical protein
MCVMKGLSGSTISICERVRCFKDTMTTKEDLVTFGCVSHCQVLLCMGRIGKQELVYSTKSSIIVVYVL